MNAVIVWVLIVIAVEAVTEIIGSTLFFPVRDFLSRSKFLAALLNCGYCTSVWVAASIAWVVPMPGGLVSPVVDYVIKLLVIHRLSNFHHDFVMKRRWFEADTRELSPPTMEGQDG